MIKGAEGAVSSEDKGQRKRCDLRRWKSTGSEQTGNT